MFSLAVLPAVTWAGDTAASTPWVRYEGGTLSLNFRQTPAKVAAERVQEATGIRLSLPPSAENKSVTLRVDRRPLVTALRQFLQALDLGSFALVYDGEGRAREIIVLGATGRTGAVPSSPASPPTPSSSGAGMASARPPSGAPGFPLPKWDPTSGMTREEYKQLRDETKRAQKAEKDLTKEERRSARARAREERSPSRALAPDDAGAPAQPSSPAPSN